MIRLAFLETFSKSTSPTILYPDFLEESSTRDIPTSIIATPSFTISCVTKLGLPTADIIISALGVPNFVKAEMVKDGAVVIDVGITRVKDDSEKGYKIVGDVDYENVANKSSFITPVPGGVGPMTIAMLLTNTLKAYLQRIN